jgi:hypothetical protein
MDRQIVRHQRIDRLRRTSGKRAGQRIAATRLRLQEADRGMQCYLLRAAVGQVVLLCDRADSLEADFADQLRQFLLLLDLLLVEDLADGTVRAKLTYRNRLINLWLLKNTPAYKTHNRSRGLNARFLIEIYCYKYEVCQGGDGSGKSQSSKTLAYSAAAWLKSTYFLYSGDSVFAKYQRYLCSCGGMIFPISTCSNRGIMNPNTNSASLSTSA